MGARVKKTVVIDGLIFWLVLFFCFFIRLLYAVSLEISIPIRGDAFSYVQYAVNLIEHGVFSKDEATAPMPDSYWAPGYPYFLMLCSTLGAAIGIDFYPVALFLQALMGAITSALTFSVARLIMPSRAAGIVAILTIFSPHLMAQGGYILSETLFTFLLMSSIYIYFKAISKQYSLWLAGFGGFVFGLAYLTNPVVLFVPIAFVLHFLIQLCFDRESISSPRFVVIFLGVFLVCVLSWVARCVVNVPADRLTSSDRAFENLIIGSHNDYHAIWRNNPRDPQNPYEIDYQKYKNDHVGFYKELAARVVDEPLHYLHWYFMRKPLELWGWDILVGYGDIYTYEVDSSLYQKSKLAIASLVIMKHTHYWLFLAAILGLFFVFKESDVKQKEYILNVYLCVFCISTIYVVLHSDGRYSVPMRPEMYLCAVYAISKLIELKNKYKNREAVNA